MEQGREGDTMFDGLKKWGNTESDTGLFEMGDFPFLTADLYIWEKAEKATQSKMGQGRYLSLIHI